MPNSRFKVVLQTFLFAVFAPAVSWGQSGASGAAGPTSATGENPRTITLVESVSPSFNIEPVVHRFNGRRGEVIPFRFVIKSTGKSMNVVVELVSLRQELTGIILHDQHSPAPEDARLTSPTEFALGPGDSQEITGELTVPLARTNYLSYGILVKDLGVSSNNSQQLDPADVTTKASIRFVTQYVLRLDIQTGLVSIEGLGQIDLKNGLIRSVQGLPVAEAILENPTDMALECQVSGEVVSVVGGRPKAFLMSLPCRESMAGNEKYLVRLMPHSRVLVRAPVEQLLFPGAQTLRLTIRYGRRDLLTREFPIEVHDGEFPAVETKMAYLPQRIALEPAQIEIGKAVGMHRSLALKFSNTSDKPRMITLDARDLADGPLAQMRLSTESFEVAPGRYKNVRASIEAKSDDNESFMGKILVSVSGDDGETKQQEVPIALVGKTREEPRMDVDPIEYLQVPQQTAFRVTVKNEGNAYVPVHGILKIGHQRGLIAEAADGFGKWIPPGGAHNLDFLLGAELAEGDYQLVLEVQGAEGMAPITQSLDLHLPIDAPQPEDVAENQSTEPAAL